MIRPAEVSHNLSLIEVPVNKGQILKIQSISHYKNNLKNGFKIVHDLLQSHPKLQFDFLPIYFPFLVWSLSLGYSMRIWLA